MLKARYLIGFTGHRSGFDETLIRTALKSALVDLKKRAESVGGAAELYASVAEGADILCVEVARDLGMPVHLLLPLPESEFEKDFSSTAARDRSHSQLELSRQKPGRNSVRLVPGKLQRPDCYFDLASHMLEVVDVLVAVWDGKHSRGTGGTKEVIDRAHMLGLPVVLIDSATGQYKPPPELEAAFYQMEKPPHEPH